MTAPRTLELKGEDLSQKVQNDLKKALELFSSGEVHIKDLIQTIQYAKSQNCPLNLAERDKSGTSIITLAAAANEVEFLKSLLVRPEFHPSVYKFGFYELRNAESCEIVDVFIKHFGLEELKKNPEFALLRMSDHWYFMLDFYNKKEAEEPECKQLTTNPHYKEEDGLKWGYTNEAILDMLYQRGTNEINNNKKLLKNYNKIVQTCAGDKYDSRRSKGQLKALYIMRVALDKMSASEIWNIHKNYVTGNRGSGPFIFPNKTGFPSYYAAPLLVRLYILNNQDKFSFLKEKDFEEIQPSKMSCRDIKFTGHIPQYGFISRENWHEVINSVMANKPKKDLFNLLTEVDKEEKLTAKAPEIKSDVVHTTPIALTSVQSTPPKEEKKPSEIGVHVVESNEIVYAKKPLGSGGYGIVYKAKWKNKIYAVKKLHQTTLSRSTDEAFDEEVRLMIKSTHPNVVNLYAVCKDPGNYAMIMECMKLGSLQEHLKDRTRVPEISWKDRIKIALDITQGLAHIHSLKILHRDLKSGNVLLKDEDNEIAAKISDFGLAAVKKETMTASKVHADPGSVRWQAPELLELRPKHTKETDIYSLGMIFWELASRELPYDDVPLARMCMFIEAGKVEPVPEDCKCPEEFAALIDKCRQKDPTKRPTTAEIETVLQKLYAKLRKDAKKEETSLVIVLKKLSEEQDKLSDDLNLLKAAVTPDPVLLPLEPLSTDEIKSVPPSAKKPGLFASPTVMETPSAAVMKTSELAKTVSEKNKILSDQVTLLRTAVTPTPVLLPVDKEEKQSVLASISKRFFR